MAGTAESPEVPSHPKESDDRKAAGTVPAPSITQWGSPQGTGGLRHHLQMHWPPATRPGSVCLQRWTFSCHCPCCHECQGGLHLGGMVLTVQNVFLHHHPGARGFRVCYLLPFEFYLSILTTALELLYH